MKKHKRTLIKVELLFTGEKKLLDAIKEHLVDSINKDFIQDKEQVVIKDIEVLK